MSWIAWIGIAVVAEVVEQLLSRIYLSKIAQYWEFLVGYSLGAIMLSLVLLYRDMQFFAGIQFTHSTATTSLVLLLSGVLWFFFYLFNAEPTSRST